MTSDNLTTLIQNIPSSTLWTLALLTGLMIFIFWLFNNGSKTSHTKEKVIKTADKSNLMMKNKDYKSNTGGIIELNNKTEPVNQTTSKTADLFQNNKMEDKKK